MDYYQQYRRKIVVVHQFLQNTPLVVTTYSCLAQLSHQKKSTERSGVKETDLIEDSKRTSSFTLNDMIDNTKHNALK